MFARQEVPEVDVETFADAHQQGATVIDVREPDEYVRAHVPGAKLIPLSEFNERYQEVPSDGTVYIICESGARSASVTQALVGAGYDAVSVAGGTGLWARTGRPVETGA
ncbi:MAG: rhodanese-like domain-containing protein [Acidimicrobiales bacterium]